MRQDNKSKFYCYVKTLFECRKTRECIYDSVDNDIHREYKRKFEKQYLCHLYREKTQEL